MSRLETVNKISVGGIEVDNPFWIAPLAGITVPAVRRFFEKQGAGLTHTEMVSCSGVIHGNRKTLRMLRKGGQKSPAVLQFFTGNADSLVQCVDKGGDTWRKSFDAFSINMACPMPKVIKKGAGAALLKRKDSARRMVEELRKAGLPVWVKMRLVSAGDLSETLRFVETLIEAGADHVTLHGRTPAQRYEGSADMEAVCRVASAFCGMVSASGDVFSPQAAMTYLERGASAVFFARGILRDPFIVERTLDNWRKVPFSSRNNLSPAVKIKRLMDLGEDLYRDEGEKICLVLLKRFLSSIFKGLRGASRFRRDVADTHSWEETVHVLENWRELAERSDLNG